MSLDPHDRWKNAVKLPPWFAGVSVAHQLVSGHAWAVIQAPPSGRKQAVVAAISAFAAATLYWVMSHPTMLW